ncbi:MAG: endoribonuclease MazF [Bacillota bacterium]
MVTAGTIYIPGRGDIVWLQFNPQSGHEQAGKRPALVISPQSYNGKVGLALVCPVTSKAKGYPFEVLLPDGLEVSGVVLPDQIESLDWQARDARYVCTAPLQVMMEVLGKMQLLIS